MTRIRVLFGVAAAAMAVGLWFALTAPPDALQGEYSRIINVHVPSLWLAFLAFGVTALGSIMWLWKKKQRWDRLASASAEIGVLFTGIGLFTGMVWGQAVWGRAWDWGDPRLTSTAVMFFVYLGYIALRNAVDDPVVKARRSAILGVVAVVQVPLVYFSVNLFRTLHQTQSIRPDGSTMPSGDADCDARKCRGLHHSLRGPDGGSDRCCTHRGGKSRNRVARGRRGEATKTESGRRCLTPSSSPAYS